jgi:hypothetical protein
VPCSGFCLPSEENELDDAIEDGSNDELDELELDELDFDELDFDELELDELELDELEDELDGGSLGTIGKLLGIY